MSRDRTSYSALTQHRSCPQAWVYRQIRQLERDNPEQVKAELEFGNWWHALRAADSLQRGRELRSIQHTPRKIRTVDDGPDLPTTVTPEEVILAAGKWWSTLSTDYREVWVERMGEPVADRLSYVDARWRERWADALAEEHPLGVEVYWQRELPSSGEGDPNTLLVGFIDEVYWDSKRDLVVIRDHKSIKTMPTSAAPDIMDSQLQLYAWGAGPQITGWGRGKVRALAYDRVRMTAPKPPSVTTTGTLSKSVTDFDLHTYRTWASGPSGEGVLWGTEGAEYVSGTKKGQPKWGYYTEDAKVVAALSDPAAVSAWFQRTLTPINPNLVKVHLQSAVDSAHDTQRTRAREAETGQAARNLTKNCKWCDFQSLCRAEMIGGVGGEYDLAEHYLKPIERRKK